MSQGHRESELVGYSLDKLRFFFRLASDRQGRVQCAYELTLMRAVRNSVASIMDKKGDNHYFSQERLLTAMIEGDVQDQSANVEKLEGRLLALGARRKYIGQG